MVDLLLATGRMPEPLPITHLQVLPEQVLVAEQVHLVALASSLSDM
jgi:hypothetical protein